MVADLLALFFGQLCVFLRLGQKDGAGGQLRVKGQGGFLGRRASDQQIMEDLVKERMG